MPSPVTIASSSAAKRARMDPVGFKMPNFADDFRAGVAALDAAGLDTVALLEFMEDHLKEDFVWPRVLLEEFFHDRLMQLVHLPTEVNRSSLLRLGVRPDGIDKIWGFYEKAGPEWTIEDVLNNYFKSVVDASDLARHIAEAEGAIAETASSGPAAHSPGEKTIEIHRVRFENLASLRAAQPPSVDLHVQEPSLPLGTTGKRTIPVLEAIPNGPDLMYHSTTIPNAASIIEVGPFVPTSRLQADFNGAFYLNTSLADAEGWAKHLARSAADNTAVILVYRVTREYLSGLNVHRTTPESWYGMVSAFRGECLGMTSIEDFLSYDVVIGPKCRNPRGALVWQGGRGREWIPEAFQDQGDQVAFTNPKEANRLKHNLVGLKFYHKED